MFEKMKLMKINVNTITIGLIVGGMILSSSLYVKAFSPTNNTAACVAAAALATNAANAANAAANEERERDNDKEPDIVTTVLVDIPLLFICALLFMGLSGLAVLFLEKDNDI